MKEKIQSWLRPGRKVTDQVILATILSLVALFLGTGVADVLFIKTNFNAKLAGWTGSESIGTFLGNYMTFIGIWASVLLFVLIPRFNRPMMQALTHNRRGNNLKGALAGLLLGFGCNAICVLISYLTGHIKLSYNGIDAKILLMFFVAIFIQSGAEELTDRFYMYQKLRRRYKSPAFAMIANSFVFMFLHVTNPGFTVVAGSQIFIVGVVFSLLVYYYDSLWAAMFFHTAWNYTQNIIFGLPNSGIVSEYSIFKLEAASATNGLFYNVNFGVEGSIGSSIILGLLMVAIIMINRGKPEKHDIWAAADEAALSGGGKHAKH